MVYLVTKALHLIGIVCWFAGLFYVVRLFIYHTEALDETEPKRNILTAQFTLMARRLWLGITVPSMVITVFTGSWLLSYHDVPHTRWLHLKLTFAALLLAYHFHCGWIRQRLAAGARPFSSRQLRVYNEVATFLLVAMVFTAVGKSAAFGLKALAGCAVVFVVLGAFFLKKLQGKS